MVMKISSPFFSFLFLSLFLSTSADAQISNCQPVQCSHEGPNVTLPFYLNSQPQDCGEPGFELTCRSNATMIKLPYHKELIVKSISYQNRRFNLLDPENCLHEVFLNLDLSGTPFKYYYTIKSFTYVNCSNPISLRSKLSFPEVPCLSGPGHHVYTVKSSLFASLSASWDRSASCRVAKVVEIPFAYSPYLSDSSFGLGLTWENDGSCEGCRGRENRAEGEDGGLSTNQIAAGGSITVLILVVMAALVLMKIRKIKVQDGDAKMDEQVLLHTKNLIG
ncbi:hypothetical protein SAY86_000002 [Trapa natans]|uniref:RING-type E3 ubiquitin transferase n=1 Tax=Trapa natans TaxID=22666 RepID=A0AAN7RDM7_TRANT|nr:hypothetical protein SAY86_000002 [Trapa natans]